ncbi:putative RNA-directed DNA polymerase [Helianthus annuus]|nr:putative RNA-directed DNA polymerase [Helianthus annuus]
MAGRWWGNDSSRRYYGNGNGKPVTTFFVTNLPDGVTQSLLWTAFMPHGVVKDAYVAKKRDARGNYFGFIRIEGVSDLERVLKGMNNVKIYDAKLSVSVARFGKNQRQNVQNNNYRPSEYRHKVTNVQPARVYVPKPVLNKGLFSEVVTGNMGGGSSSKKVLLVEDRAALYPDHCIMRSIISDVINVKEFGNVKNMLMEAGCPECSVGYIGGLKVLVVFKDKRSAVDFVARKKEVWEKVFSSAVLWEGQHFGFERLACLKMTGMPIQLRDPKFYDRIGELFGTLVSGSEFSWQQVNNSIGTSWVLTSTAKRIDEEVEIEWNGGQFKVWVIEEDNKSLECIVNDLSSQVGEPPEESVESVVGDEDEVEEGEFLNSARKTNKEIPVPEHGGPVTEVNETIERTWEGGGEELHGEQTENEEVHGDNTQPKKIKEVINATHSPTQEKYVGESTRLPFDLNKSFGSFMVGSTHEETVRLSRKRPRRCRSPSQEIPNGPDGSMGGPDCNRNPLQELIKKSKVTAVTPNYVPIGADRNRDSAYEDVTNNVSPHCDGPGDSCRRTDGDNRPEKPMSDNAPAADVGRKELGDNQVGREEDLMGDSLADEVQATLEVGTGVGFQLGGFDNQVVDAVGSSGGLMSLWNPAVFDKVSSIKRRHFLIVTGIIKASGDLINIVNVHAQNDPVARRGLWEELRGWKGLLQGLWLCMGDFNDVRIPSERRNSEFVAANADSFNRFIESAELFEYNMGGRQFTYRSDNGQKMSKLDRCLVSKDFRDMWPDASVVALNNVASDHCPVILSTIPHDFGPTPTPIFNSWMELPGFLEFVNQLCAQFQFSGPADLGLGVKIKWVKKKAREWVLNQKKQQDGQYVMNLNKLEALEIVAESRDWTEEELATRTNCKKFILEADRLKTMDIKQKSRVKWAVDGDENTAYFHGIMNANTTNNRICGLQIEGEWVENPVIIKDHVANFFGERFAEPMMERPQLICPNLAQLSDEEAESLVAPFSLEEIKSAVWDCHGDRAPGPDGVNFGFIKRCWAGFQQDFINLFNEFYLNPSINLGCTASFLALIPKCSDPSGLADFRPISLIGCINKIISKVLVKRLKVVIHKLISEEQTAFLSNRSILDGPIILNEVVAWMKKAKKRGMIFKVDIEKAYDTLNWGFLKSIMCQMAFPNRWVDWVMAIVTTVKASVLVNGSPSQEFVCHRGLRQGDPISPFLFVMAMEALSGVVKKAVSLGFIHGIQCTPQGPVLSHFLYADDAVFLGEWSVENARNINRIMRCFYMASGLKVNLGKSSLFGVGVDEAEITSMAGILRCRAGSFPFKYLGLQVGANMNLVRNWKPVVDTFKSRLSVWKANTLSYGGRLTLVKSVLNALPTYYFSLFRAPVQIIKELERLRRDFLWGNTPEHQRATWVAWNDIMAPKESGGAGLGSLKETNLALLAKWWWRFKVEDNNIWKKVVWSIHQHNRSWSPMPVKMSMPGPWKQIVGIAKDLWDLGIDLASCFRAAVGSGLGILFWLDCWIADVPLRILFPELFQLETNKKALVADRVKVQAGVRYAAFSWSRCPQQQQEIKEMLDLSNMLEKIIITENVDAWRWVKDTSGSFSVHGLRKLLRPSPDGALVRTHFWNKWCPLKVNFLSWRLYLNRLPTKEALWRRNVQMESTDCVLCDESMESGDHIFAACRYVQEIWEDIFKWCRINTPFFFCAKDVLEIYRYCHGSRRWKNVVYSVIQTAIWCIWRMRNDAVFNNKRVAVANVVNEIKVLSFLWIKNRAKAASLTWENWCMFDLVCMNV